jgi:hypothetical protein
MEIFGNGVGYSTDFASDRLIYEGVGDGVDGIDRPERGDSFRIKAGLRGC